MYRLKKWYPSLPEWMKEGTIVEITPGKEYTQFTYLDQNLKKRTHQANIKALEYEEFWEKVEYTAVNERLGNIEKCRAYLSNDEKKEIEKSTNTFEQLCTIAKAWNKADGFKLESWSKIQTKHSIFYDPAKKEFDTTSYTEAIDSPFIFKTEERAKQFADQFKGLLKDLLSIR